MIKKNIYIWTSDYSNFTGEGNLARLFVKKKLKKKYNTIICKHKPKNYFSKNILNHKYFLPFLGVINCWKYFILGKNTCYLNYLPYWNFFIFMFLPPHTILGPITGGSYFKREFNLNYFVRNFIFPILYNLSSLILFFRSSKIIFSTDLLKKHLGTKLIKKSEFNFVLNALNPKIKIKQKKNIDLIIYYKKHKNKMSLYPIDFIKKIVNLNFKVCIVGDNLNIHGVKNLGYLERKKLINVLNKCKYSISSGENFFSFFTMECINSNVKIITNKKINKLDKSIKNQILYINTDKKIKKQKIKHFLRDF